MVLLNSKNVLAPVQARSLTDQPFGRPQGPSREGDSVGGPVRDLHALPVGRKNHRMLAHDVARTHARETDAAGAARAALAGPVINRDLRQVPANVANDGLAHREPS